MKAIINAQDFKRLVSNTKKFVGDNTNKLMTWIYLEIDENRIKATALDGHRVAVEYASVIEASQSFKCYIKPDIPKITKYDRFVELELVDNKAYITVGDSIRGYKQPEGEYYKTDTLIESAIQKEPIISVGVNVKYLIDALQSAKRDDSKSVILKITGAKDPIVVKGLRDKEDNIKLVLPVSINN